MNRHFMVTETQVGEVDIKCCKFEVREENVVSETKQEC